MGRVVRRRAGPLTALLAAVETTLSPGFEHGNRDCVGKIEAAIAGTQGDPHPMIRRPARQDGVIQAAGFRAKQQDVVRLILNLVVTAAPTRRERQYPAGG